MAQENTVEQRVSMVLMDQLGVDQEDITQEAMLAENLGADSLDIAEVIMVLEEEFDIEMPDVVDEDIKTVGQVVAYIEKCIAEK